MGLGWDAAWAVNYEQKISRIKQEEEERRIKEKCAENERRIDLILAEKERQRILDRRASIAKWLKANPNDEVLLSMAEELDTEYNL